MGLDQFLFRRKKSAPADDRGDEVMYWRKANQIRQWMITNADYGVEANCELHPLSKEQIELLRDDCKSVVDNRKYARQVLPTSDGFFFGSTEYDEWYYENLERTVQSLDEILRDTDFEIEEVCYYEWW